MIPALTARYQRTWETPMSSAGRIMNDATELDEDVYAAADDAVAGAEQSLHRRTADIERMLSRLEDTVSDIYDTVADKGARSIETVEELVEESPWISIFTAFAVGALAAHLLSRR
jgi:ElaB/YqjD/DUF883 family membrane-anchored ribosome-binding protein